MKAKILLLILSVIFTFSLLSCGTNTDTGSGDKWDTSGGDTNQDNSSGSGLEGCTVGTKVGNKLPSFSVQLFDENGTMQEYIDPTTLGKITVINFWGTWCHPCVNELPHFSEIATEYKDEVSVVAIHSVKNFTVNAVDFVRNDYSESDIIFAKDKNTTGSLDDCYTALGGVGYYPYTIIINANGIITYKTFGAITKATLISEIEKARI